MATEHLPRDKNDVLKPLSLPSYCKEQHLDQRGDWVLVAVLPMRGGHKEAVPVLDYEDRTFLQRYQNLEELRQLAARNSAVRVNGGMAINLRTGETVRVNAMR